MAATPERLETVGVLLLDEARDRLSALVERVVAPAEAEECFLAVRREGIADRGDAGWPIEPCRNTKSRFAGAAGAWLPGTS